MKYIIEIEMDNAAFEDEDCELSRILRQIADTTEERNELYEGKLRDINGNTCGETRIENGKS